MKSSVLQYVLTVVVFSQTVAGSLSARVNLAPDQIALLMRASSERYTSFDAKIKVTGYRYDREMAGRQMIGVEEITWRWTRQGDKLFCRRDWNPIGDDPNLMKRGIYTTALTAKWIKKLAEFPGSNSPARGEILVEKVPRTAKVGEFLDPYEAMWSIFGWSWDKVDFHSVSLEEDGSYYVLNCYLASKGPKGAKVTLYIDPSKGFIPAKREICKSDGTVMIREWCDKFIQTTGGLYVPWRYHSFYAPYNEESVFEIQAIAVNEPIADDLFDFDFPGGTIVRDERIGSIYKVGKVTHAEVARDVLPVSGTEALAADDELRSAAAKAKELLKAEAAKGAAPVSIEIWPEIVLLERDKTGYSLSVKRSDGIKPVLADYQFASDQLELSLLEDLIDDQDKLVITVTRRASCTGFVKGTLMLYWRDDKKPSKVLFVGPPLEVVR